MLKEPYAREEKLKARSREKGKHLQDSLIIPR